MPSIRPAKSEDADAVSRCVTEAYSPWVQRIGRKPWPMLQDYVAVLREASVTVAEVGGRVVGVLVEGRRLRQRTVYLYTNELMVENIALYVRHGYVEYERRQEQGFRRVFMRKALPEPT